MFWVRNGGGGEAMRVIVTAMVVEGGGGDKEMEEKHQKKNIPARYHHCFKVFPVMVKLARRVLYTV